MKSIEIQHQSNRSRSKRSEERMKEERRSWKRMTKSLQNE